MRWDETSTIPRPERVSPWKIEPALAPPALNSLPMPRPKRPRSNMLPSSPDSSVLTREGVVTCTLLFLFIFTHLLFLFIFTQTFIPKDHLIFD